MVKIENKCFLLVPMSQICSTLYCPIIDHLDINLWLKERRSSDEPKFLSSSRGQYFWCYDVLTDMSLAWLLSERPNKQLKESDVLTPNWKAKAWDPCDWSRERLEEGDLIGIPTISTKLDPQDLSDNEPPTRQHTLADMGPAKHWKQRTAWFGHREDAAPNPQETWGPRE